MHLSAKSEISRATAIRGTPVLETATEFAVSAERAAKIEKLLDDPAADVAGGAKSNDRETSHCTPNPPLQQSTMHECGPLVNSELVRCEYVVLYGFQKDSFSGAFRATPESH